MGGLMMFFWVIRFFVFNLYENPKYLMGRGRDEQAVEVIHKVAAYNGKTSNLTLEDLQRAGKLADAAVDDDIHTNTSALATVRRKMQVFSLNHAKPLFATRKMALSTTILIIVWGKSALRAQLLQYRLMFSCSFSFNRPRVSTVGLFIFFVGILTQTCSGTTAS
jgi:hypothetical protein